MYMKEVYEKLGFKKPEYLENPYGIKIYIGTKHQSDWCVEIPKEICNENIHVFYLITEEKALSIAEKYTRIAKRNEGGN